jgi:hypothetical protein
MTSGKEKAAAIQARRKVKREAARAERRAVIEQRRRQRLLDEMDVNSVAVDLQKLAGYQGYSVPLYVTRGFYVPVPFTCRDCGQDEMWTPRQQKWWYEEAKGDPFSTATRCRVCRRRERDRKAAHKRASEEGRARKRAASPDKAT